MKGGFKRAVNLISTEPQFIALRSNSQRYFMGFTSWKDIVVFCFFLSCEDFFLVLSLSLLHIYMDKLFYKINHNLC